MYMAMGVMKARKAHNIQFPALYADKDNCASAADAVKFNCVQRGEFAENHFFCFDCVCVDVCRAAG
jgi:hypothetical protein